MTDIVLVPVTGGSNLSAINSNFDKIEEVINTDVLHLKGGNNVMKQDLDLNGNNILNYETDVNNPNSLISVGDADARYYNVNGDSLSGNMNAAGNKILNLPAANAPHEPVRKAEFDQATFDSAFTLRNDLANDVDPAKGIALVGYRGRNVRERFDTEVYPEEFGAVGDGVTEDAAAFGVFIDYLLSTGAKGVGTPGAMYKISSSISKTLVENNSLILDLNGATLLQGGNNTVFSLLNSDSGGVKNVSAITQVSFNLGNGATNTQVMQVASVGHPFTEAGQLGKIFSDDVVPDNDGSNQFCGEWFVVGAIIDADNFVTTGIFDETYTTTIRVVKPSNAHVEIDNFSGKSVWADGVTASFATFQGFIYPKFRDFKARDINAVFANFTSCYVADVDGVGGRRIKNRPDLGAFGYLVNDSAGYATQVSGIHCVYARHAYTTTTPTSAVPGDNKWWLRGRTIDSEVRDSFGQGCANAFDTHSPALRVRFVNCKTADDFRGNDTGGAGIQFRGNDCSAIDCDVSQSKIGLAYSGASRTTAATLKVDNLKYRSRGDGHTPVSINGNASFETRATFNGGDLTDVSNPAFTVTNANLFVRHTKVAMSPANNGTAVVLLNTGAKVFWTGGEVSWSSGNTHVIVEHGADSTIAYVDGLSITGVSGRQSYFSSSSAGFTAIESRFTRIQTDAALPGVPFLGFAAVTPRVSAQYVNGYNTRPLGFRVFTFGVAGNQAIDIQFAGDESVFVRIEATIAGVVINSLSQGAFPGQRCIINNRNTSTNSFVIANNSGGLLLMGTSATLTVGRGITLVWDGSNWRSADQHA